MSSATTFFERILPHAIFLHRRAFLSTRGRIGFALPPQGRWTIRFGDVEHPIVPTLDHDADLHVWMGPSAFAEFRAGTLDIPDALARRRLRLKGNHRLMHRLAALLTFDTTPLTARVSQARSRALETPTCPRP